MPFMCLPQSPLFPGAGIEQSRMSLIYRGTLLLCLQKATLLCSQGYTHTQPGSFIGRARNTGTWGKTAHCPLTMKPEQTHSSAILTFRILYAEVPSQSRAGLDYGEIAPCRERNQRSWDVKTTKLGEHPLSPKCSWVDMVLMLNTNT